MSSRIALATAAALIAAPLAAQQRVELPARDRPLTLETRTLYQVGAVDGEAWETFAGVTDLAFAPDGSLYLLDAGAHRVIAFDPAGRFLRFIGRQGGGPGEFTFPTGIAVLASGELVVNDGGRGSLQLFAPDGTFLRSVPVDEELGRAVGRLRPSGDALITETMQLRRALDPGAPPSDRFQLPPRSVTRLELGESAAGRRLFNAPPREAKLNNLAQAEGGTVRMRMSMTAFEPSLLWTPLPNGGLAAMHTADYRIGLVDGQGRPQRYLERPIAPRKVTAADRKRFLERRKSADAQVMASGTVMAFRSGGSGSAPAAPPPSMMRMSMADLQESDVTWGDVIPVVTALGADSRGRLWIQRSAPDQEPGPIDLVGPDLAYLGTLAPQPMPRAFGPDGRLAWVERDELDVQRVVVRQLVR